MEKKYVVFFKTNECCWSIVEKSIESVNWKRRKKVIMNYLFVILSMKSQILYEKYPPPAKWLTLQIFTKDYLILSKSVFSTNKQTSLKTEYNLTPLISIFFVKCGLKYPAKKVQKNKKERSLLCTLTKKRW